jgi:hypothetical protein
MADDDVERGEKQMSPGTNSWVSLFSSIVA